MMSLMNTVWQNWLSLLGLALVGPLVVNLCISAITSQTVTRIIGRYGVNAQSYWGCLGIIIHEGAHLLMALVFGHQIDEVKFFAPPKEAAATARLGYVAHSYNPHNLYQRLGNFFIGQAPIAGIVTSMLLVTKLVWPQLLEAAGNLAWAIGAVSWWQLVLWMCIMLSLSLGLNLSRADWHNTWSGLGLYAGLLLVLALILALLEPSYFVNGLEWGLIAARYYLILLGLVLVVNVAVVMLTKVF